MATSKRSQVEWLEREAASPSMSGAASPMLPPAMLQLPPSPTSATNRSPLPTPSPRPSRLLLAALQRAAKRIVELRGFEAAINVAIALNSVQTAFREPTPWWDVEYTVCSYSPSPTANAVLTAVDVGFTSLFCVELCLKLLCHGPTGYLRDGWNWIDGFVTLIAALALLPAPFCVHFSGLSALRAVRLLRAMRAAPQFRAMGATVQAFLDATPKLGHVGLLAFFFFTCFGVLGVQLFMGNLQVAEAPPPPPPRARPLHSSTPPPFPGPSQASFRHSPLPLKTSFRLFAMLTLCIPEPPRNPMLRAPPGAMPRMGRGRRDHSRRRCHALRGRQRLHTRCRQPAARVSGQRGRQRLYSHGSGEQLFLGDRGGPPRAQPPALLGPP